MILILLVSAAVLYFAFPFLRNVEERQVEQRGTSMCERILKANDLAKLYPVPQGIDCSCYSKVLATNYSPEHSAAFLNRKRLQVLSMASRFVGMDGELPTNTQEDTLIFRDMFRTCPPWSSS